MLAPSLKPDPGVAARVGVRVLTVGHSNREPAAFVGLLRQHGVRMVVDIRTVPRSKRVPWTSIDQLPQLLSREGIGYAHIAGLGGLRRPKPDSVNDGWRNESFRGYADHMRTAEFHRALDELVHIARGSTTAIMCAEAVPWRCHRSLVADALLARGAEVAHILDGEPKPHALTSFARVDGTRVTYPAAPGAETSIEAGGEDEG